MKLTYCSILVLISFLSACKKEEPDPIPKNINRELLGVWNNDNGCIAKYTIKNNTLILESFNDAKGHQFSQLALHSKKYGVATNFNSDGDNFKGTYLEGSLIIDKYCNEALHKIGN